MKKRNLSKRMEAVVNMVSPQSFAIADVGCDHAYVAISLIERKLAKKVIAMDVRKGPLEIAMRNVKDAGLSEDIHLRLGDGLERLQVDEVDTIIIAGMGGLLVNRILEQGKAILKDAKNPPTLILQPQSDLNKVRIFLYDHAYHIVREKMLVDEGKYYTVIKAEPLARRKGRMSEEEWMDDALSGMQTEADFAYGRYNLKHKDEVLYRFLQKERKNLLQILENLEMMEKNAQAEGQSLPEKTAKRLLSVKQELKINQCAFAQYEKRDIDEM